MVAEAGITRTFQNIRLFKKLTVYENVLTACHNNAKYNLIEGLLRLPKCVKEEKQLKEQTDNLLKIMGLESRKDLIATLS